MPSVQYGGADGTRIELVEEKRLIAVRTRSQKSLRSRTNVAAPIESHVADCDLLYQFPEAGVEIYRLPQGEKVATTRARKTALRAAPDVLFAGGVLVDAESRSPVLYTENLYVRFVDQLDGESCEALIRAAGLSIKEKMEFAVNAYFVAATEGVGQRVFDIALELLDNPDVEVCHPELIRPKDRKVFFPQQWHLASTTIGGMTINQHSHIDAAHALTRGAGVTIAVIDDGFDIEHPELSGPGKIVAPYDAMSRTNDPRPRDHFFADDHGTACAGVACAAGVDGAAGVAPDAKLMPIRLAANLGSMAEARAFKWAADNGAAVLSCSWGPPDGRWYDPNDPLHSQLIPLPDSTRDAIHYAVTQGRNGLGCVIFFAAGNGNESVENDGYASHDRVMAVAACNDRGTRSVYSDIGDSLWCCFPSNDFGFPPFGHPDPLTTGIWTTDRQAGAGYNAGDTVSGDLAGDYTNAFGGTSSACPGAAGVAALVLAVNANLTWTEVRDIMRDCCDQIDTASGNYGADGHSELYGYGRLNAMRAVQLAQPRQAERIRVSKTFFKRIPDQGAFSADLEIFEAGVIEDLNVRVDIAHTFVGDLVLTLKAPGVSQPVVLQSRQGGSGNNLRRSYRASLHEPLASLLGNASQGTWTLRIEDQASRDVGTLESFGLEITLASTADSPSTDSKAELPTKTQTPTKTRAATKKRASSKTIVSNTKRASRSKPTKKKTRRKSGGK